MIEADLYPAFLDLRGRRCLIVGEGPLADEKAGSLSRSGAVLTCIPAQDFDEAAIEGHFLVVAATADRATDERIFRAAEVRGTLVNTPDVPELCSFILPAIVRRGPLCIAVSTSGASPAMASRLKSEIARQIGPQHEQLALLLDGLRPWAKANLPDYAARRDLFDDIVNGSPDPLALLAEGDEEAVVRLIEEAKDRASGRAEGASRRA